MSALALKLIAITTMTADHFGAVIWHIQWLRDAATLMRAVGRVAFPLFCFLIVQGVIYTHKREKYLARLAIFAVISILPFGIFLPIVMGVGGFFYTGMHNVLFTLLGGAAAACAYDAIRERLSPVPGVLIGLLPAVGFGVLVHFMNSDFGEYGLGVALIFVIYLTQKRFPKGNLRHLVVLPILVWAGVFYFGSMTLTIFAAVPALFISIYNGKQGNARASQKLKIWFYIYYPAHLLVLSGLVYFMTIRVFNSL